MSTRTMIAVPRRTLEALQSFIARERDDVLMQVCSLEAETGEPIRSTMPADCTAMVVDLERWHAELTELLQPSQTHRRLTPSVLADRHAVASLEYAAIAAVIAPCLFWAFGQLSRILELLNHGLASVR